MLTPLPSCTGCRCSHSPRQGATLFPHSIGHIFIAFTLVSAEFLGEVHAGDTLYSELVITDLTAVDGSGRVTTRATIRNQRGEQVLEGRHTYLLRLS